MVAVDCTVLYSTALYSTVLYSTILYSTELYYKEAVVEVVTWTEAQATASSPAPASL